MVAGAGVVAARSGRGKAGVDADDDEIEAGAEMVADDLVRDSRPEGREFGGSAQSCSSIEREKQKLYLPLPYLVERIFLIECVGHSEGIVTRAASIATVGRQPDRLS